MNFKSKKIQKITSSLVLVALLSPAFAVFWTPKKAEAQLTDPVVAAFSKLIAAFTGKTSVESTVSTGVLLTNLAKAVANEALKVAAKKVLQEMTKSTVNWINTGHFGNPLFLENPESFFGDIARYEIKSLIDATGYDPRRFPFGKQFALNTINNYKSQLESNAEYSLSKVTNDEEYLYNYRNNFSVGGWNGFLLHTQYPQNNPIGYQMEATNELARRIQNAEQKINDTLEQGSGFLSPQFCPSNPSYDPEGGNEFQRETFKFIPPSNLKAPKRSAYKTDKEFETANKTYTKQLAAAKETAHEQWAKKNECPGGLVRTTPGSVVASSIMTSLSGGQRLTELQAALGGSLSAVFDALLNKFLGTGLSSLATDRANPYTEPDNWDYYGNTLGSPTYNNADPFSGPDQEIIVSEFRAKLTRDIANTQAELKLMENPDPSNFGLFQILSLTWPKARELDICTPGPDLGWEDRLTDEMNRNSQKLQEKTSDGDGTKAFEAVEAIKELKLGVDILKEWIQTAMIKNSADDLGLPGSIIYIDAVKEAAELGQQATELNNKRREKAQALARLQAIQGSLSSPSFSTQPAPGSQAEKDLITIWKQYDALFTSISSTFSIDDTEAELEIAKERLGNLNKLVADCTTERKDAGWTTPSSGSWADSLNSSDYFSILPKQSGKLLRYEYQLPENLAGDNNNMRRVETQTIGSEMEQFCLAPMVGGYRHHPFGQHTTPPQYPEIPTINIGKVYSYKSGIAGSTDVNITLKCNNIYRATILDYKGNIPASLGVPEPKHVPAAPDRTVFQDIEEMLTFQATLPSILQFLAQNQ